MNKWIEILLGLILLNGTILVWAVSGSWGRWNFHSAAVVFFEGGLIWFVALIGLILIILGISDLRD